MMAVRYAAAKYNAAAGTREAFAALSADLEAEGLPSLYVNDGDREPQDEIDMFLSRFRPQAAGNGAYNDVRYWRGVRYVRFSPLGTVSVPGTGNHGKRRANDLGYPYNSDTPAHRRAQVLARRHNITCEGMGFREWWHWTYWGALGSIMTPGVPAVAANTSKPTAPLVPKTGVPDMFLFYAGEISVKNAYLAIYDGRTLKVRPTQGVEAKALIAATPNIPRVQLSADEVIDLASQGGYHYDAKAGVGRDSEGRVYTF